jgi:uncharacterized membrane protein YecN with MAPEG domain
MQPHVLVGIVTVLALLAYIGMGIQVGRARTRSGIKAPAMTGDERLERAVRVQMNTLEWLPVFLTGLWLFAIYWSDLIAAALGVVWIAGRLIYARAYLSDPAKRGPGFLIQALAALALLIGALVRLIWVWFVVS